MKIYPSPHVHIGSGQGCWYVRLVRNGILTKPMGGYLSWQFVEGPIWMLTFIWNFQRFLARYFSISFMIKTLFAHWHKDALAYHGSLADKAKILVWNIISRAVGFVVRVVVLAAWMIVAVVALVVLLISTLVFTWWPFMLSAMFWWGVRSL